MNTFAARDRRKVALLSLLLLAVVGLGVAITILGPVAVAAVPGFIAAITILGQPILGLVALLFPVPFEDIFFFEGIGTITKLIGIGVAGLWFAHKILRGDSWRGTISNPLMILGVLFIGFAVVSFTWAEYTTGFRLEILRLSMVLILALLVIDVVEKWEHFLWILRALVLGGLIGAALVLAQYYGTGVRRAGEAVAGGVNATALVLVTLLPFGFLLIRSRGSLFWRIIGAAYVTVALVAVIVTFSRMSFLLIPLVFGAEAWEILRRGNGRVALVGVVAVIVIAGLRFVPTDEFTERIETIGPYIQETLSPAGTSEQPSMSGRGYHLYVAYRMFQEHPFVGVGYGNYGHQFLEYQLRVPGADRRLYTSRRNPHSSFAGILAELGIVGITLWMAMLGVCLLALRRAWRRSSSYRRSREFLIVHSVSLSFALTLAYGFYAEMQYEKIFWLVLAFAVVLERLTRATFRGEGAPERDDPTSLGQGSVESYAVSIRSRRSRSGMRERTSSRQT